MFTAASRPRKRAKANRSSLDYAEPESIQPSGTMVEPKTNKHGIVAVGSEVNGLDGTIRNGWRHSKHFGRTNIIPGKEEKTDEVLTFGKPNSTPFEKGPKPRGNTNAPQGDRTVTLLGPLHRSLQSAEESLSETGFSELLHDLDLEMRLGNVAKHIEDRVRVQKRSSDVWM